MVDPPHVGFVMEQALGHVTFAQNLCTAFAENAHIRPEWLPIAPCKPATNRLMPRIARNTTLRGSLSAYAATTAAMRRSHFDAVFFHTQSVAMLSPMLARRVPTIVSLDATPINYDAIGAHYGHHAHPGSTTEKLKQSLYARVFQSASWLVPWSNWAKASLCRDYGVEEDRVTVIPPGIELSRFCPAPAVQRPVGERIKVLFVGGDFARKGGNLLLDCMRSGLAADCELDLVTRDAIPMTPGVRVHAGLNPNDRRLLDLYQQADVFALPTYADCLGVAALEAMAAGLPVVATDVGAVAEVVDDSVTGILVEPGNTAQLGGALRHLARDRSIRERMGRTARAVAERRFDNRANADRVAGAVANAIEWWHRAANRWPAGQTSSQANQQEVDAEETVCTLW
jgi:glycosyltransferase involved in cell wall biosynthesis